MDKEERIRERARAIWETEGRPDGRDKEHWEQARREIEQEDRQQGEGSITPKAPASDTLGVP